MKSKLTSFDVLCAGCPLGLVLMVVVTSAYESDQAGAGKLFAQAKNRISDRLNRLVLIWVDAGYQGEGFMRRVMDTYHWVLQVVRLHLSVKSPIYQ